MWEVEYTNEFEAWWETLDELEQDTITFSVRLLRENGPQLKFPHFNRCEKIKTWRNEGAAQTMQRETAQDILCV